MADVYLFQPLQIVASGKAGSKWMRDDLFDRTASTDKSFHVVEGANHMALYDEKAFVDEAVSALAPFFRRTLNIAEGTRNAAEW